MDSIKNMRNYVISKHTYILESKLNGENLHTIVHDHRGKFEVPITSLQIVKKSCEAYGSEYNASLKQSRKLLEKFQKHKLPLVVGNDFGNPLILFPIFSPSAKHNMWILYNNVISISTSDSNVSVIMKNSQEVNLPINKPTLIQQIASSGILHKLIEQKWFNNRSLL